MHSSERKSYNPSGRHSSEKRSSPKEKIGILTLSERRSTVETADGEIFYIFGLRTRGYIHGDKVAIEQSRDAKEGKLPEARPTRLIERSRLPLIASIEIVRGKRELRIIKELGGLTIEVSNLPDTASIGDFFIVSYTGRREGKIIKYFGKKGDPLMVEEIIIFRNGVRTEWPEAVKNETVKSMSPSSSLEPTRDTSMMTKELGKNSPITSFFPKVELFGLERLDFRSWPTMTIDGADAKDLDDAISIARYEGGDYLLAVHIADVAEYVSGGSPIDHEAYLRGTSVYTPGRVIPMLPEILSNDRCSLHPGEPKAVLSILIRLGQDGKVKETEITEGLIESIHRGVYDEIYGKIKTLSSDEKLGTQWGSGENTVGDRGEQKNGEQSERVYSPPRPLVTFSHESNIENIELTDLYSLYRILEARRKKEGKILFEITECYFTLDEQRNVTEIKKRERNDAHMLIEEFMVLANEEVAKWCAKHKLPFLSRVHGAPDEEDMKALSEILEDASLASHLEPRHIRDHLERATDPRERYRLSRLLLPKMAKAVYGDTPKGHFGLALQYYSHFTSPIRRYPDLLVHRIIKAFLHRDLHGELKTKYTQNMKRMGKSLSEKEKQAESVERAIDSLMMCRYMSDKVGQSFHGTISGITESNVYVELDNGVEGSIFLGKVKSIYILDPIRGALSDKKGKELYRIGNPIDIKILSVDLEERRIEMEEMR